MVHEVFLLLVINVLAFVQGGGNNSPEWSDPSSTALDIYICESLTEGELVMNLYATDSEMDPLTYSISPSATQLFAIEGNSLKVKTGVTLEDLDFEGDPPLRSVDIQLKVADIFTSITIDCIIYIEDANDNAPVFGQPEYEADIPATSAIGDFVQTVTATDADGSEDNNQISFSLGGAQAAKFSIDENGQITLNDTVAAGDVYVFTVIATDSNPDDPMSSEVTISVNVSQGVVGAAPEFLFPNPKLGGDCKIYICETAAANDTVITFAATDEDTDDATLTYNIDQSDPSVTSIFEIDGKNLKVQAAPKYVEGYFNYEVYGATLEYPIIVEVSDGSSSTQLSTKICLEDVNDNPPTFLGRFYTSIPESTPGGTPVLTVMVEDYDGTSPNNQFTIALKMASDAFELDPLTSIVSTKASAAFDFDAVSEYIVKVVATDNATENQLETEQTYTITIEDAPEFVFPDPEDEDECKIYICETAAANDTVIVFAATDKDTDVETLTYSIDQSNEDVKMLFIVEGKNLVVKSDVPDDSFDYETESGRPEYNITVEVSDGRSTTRLNTKICVEDVNDNAPRFSGPFTAQVLETATEGTPVLTVTVADDDGTPENNQVTIEVQMASDKFQIDNQTSAISVKADVMFDFDVQQEYTINVTATDNAAENPLSTEQTYTVTIETAPVFLNPDPNDPDECQLYICELTQPSETFAKLAATDKTPPAGDFIYDIDSSSSRVKELFQIVGNEIIVNNSSDADFDYEKPDQVLNYTIILNVSDGNYSSMMTATLCLEDDNDHAPVFENTGSKGCISESASAGTLVLKVTAKDGDGTPANNQVTYSLSGTGSENFQIDDFGNITLASSASLNYTATQEYILNVTASDNVLDDEKIGAYDINICVLADPIIENLQTPQRVTIDENPNENDEIYQLIVTDEDNVGELSVGVKNGSNPEYFTVDDLFKVKVARGVILDAEESTGPYTLTFEATDGTSNVTSAELIITIRDTNDNKPVFTVMNPTVEIAETAEQGFVVTTINATDADIGNPDNDMQYLLSGDDSSDFSIDITSGEVSVASPLDFTRRSVYNLTVWAADSDVNPLTETTNLTITLKTGPKFTAPLDGDTLTKNENETSNGAVITELTAFDKDGDTSFSFEVVSKEPSVPSLFGVSGSNLVMLGAVDVDAAGAVDNYTVQIRVSDATGFTEDETIEVIVYIQDSNEAPTFDAAKVTTNLKEWETEGNTVYIAQAKDDDKTSAFGQSSLTYSMTGTADLVIDPQTGNINIAQGVVLNHTVTDTYTVTVTAEDGLGLTSSVEITFDVVTGAVFDDPLNNAILPIAEKDTGNNALVKALTASDKDADQAITFEITKQIPPTEPPLFDIINTNQLVITKAVDADLPNTDLSYIVELKAADGRDYTRDNFINVTVKIEDSNEYQTFDQTEYIDNVTESSIPGTVILIVTATDNDITPAFRTMQYALSSETADKDSFTVNDTTGEISVAKDLDYNNKKTYEFSLVSFDISDNPLLKSVIIKLNVITGPVFTNPVNNTDFPVAENKTGIDPVTSLTTLDKDSDGDVTVEIVEQSPPTSPAMFAIRNTDQLVMTRAVDADEPNAVLSYSLQIKVSDGRDYTPDNTIFLTVKIEDTNEPPKFEKQEYNSEVKDTSKPGTFVLSVTAIDNDITPEYSVLRYSLSSVNDDKDFFTVNDTTGDISVAKDLLDYDSKSSYKFNVVAEDRSAEPESNIVVVILKVVTAPQFDNLKGARTAEVIENSPETTTVFELQISDKDQQVEGTTVITTIDSQTPGDMFKLDGTTLITKTPGLDAETQGNYTIIFKAKAGSHETLSGELTVKILDANDEPPVIVPVGDITIAENKATTGTDSEIVTIVANDNDVTEPNNKLTFSIEGGNDDDLFAIHDSTGLLTLVNRPVSMTINEHTLRIKVVDGGTPQNEATAEVKININETIVEECTATLCQNGATCMSFVNLYSCRCSIGYDGYHCTNNINDCIPDRCYNGGQCRDGVNSFECDCSEGWTGANCTEACNNHRYGRNCASQCLCNADGIKEDVGNQMCNIQTGDCFCNARYSDNRCETDVNECAENPTICNGQANRICNNTIGGFSCLCIQGYEENNNGICTPRPVVPPIFLDGEFPVALVISTGSSGVACPDLPNPVVYAEEEAKVIQMILTKTNARRVNVQNITCGSLVYNLTAVTNDNDADKAALANAIQAIVDAGTVDIGGENVTVNSVIVENKEVQPSSQTSGSLEERVCSVYTSYSRCASGEECKYENEVPSCKNVAVDNLTLILGLGLGLLLPLLFLAILFAVIWNIKKRRELSMRRTRKWENTESASVGTRFPTRYYDNNGYSSGSLYSIKGYYGMPEVEVIKYGRPVQRF